MKIQANSFPFQSPLAVLTLALLAGSASAQGFSAETFGRASGDVPLRGLGLVLELVDAASEQPRLRLFGGAPGHPAMILLAGSRLEAPVAGPRATSFLVDPGAQPIHGTFDARGYFEVPLPDPERFQEGRPIHAQGMHTGILELADGPLVQLSHGLSLERRAVAPSTPLGFDELLPHLPAERQIAGFSDLAELIQTALDSSGDSLRLALEIEASVGLGIEIVDAKAGGKLGGEFTVTRGEDGTYEVAVGSELTVLAGVSAGTGAEAGLEGSQGAGSTTTYRFHSAPGAARGILGMLLATGPMGKSPDSFLQQSGILVSAAERIVEIQEAIEFMRANAQELERFLLEVVDVRIAAASAFHSQAYGRLVAAQNALGSAAWHQVPVRAAQLAVQRAVYEASRVGLQAAQALRNQTNASLQQVKSAIAQKSAEISAFLETIARAGRIASAVSQLRSYAMAHHDAIEFQLTSGAELEAKLGVPFVDVKGLENSATVSKQMSQRVRLEKKTAERPLRLTVKTVFERQTTVVLACIVGCEVQRTRTVEIAQVYERRKGSGWQSAGASIGLELDTHALSTMGLAVQREQGIGRSWSVSIADELFLSSGGLPSLTSIEDLPAYCGSMELALELQDRRQDNLDFAISIDISGNGGGLEIEAEWADQGRGLARASTVAEAMQVLNGAGQAIDAARGTVANLD